MTSRTIVIAAGGTGGHFFPAEALAEALVARGHHIVLMTDARAGKRANGVFAHNPQYVLRGAGVAGRGPIRACVLVLRCWAAHGRPAPSCAPYSPMPWWGLAATPPFPPCWGHGYWAANTPPLSSMKVTRYLARPMPCSPALPM